MLGSKHIEKLVQEQNLLQSFDETRLQQGKSLDLRIGEIFEPTSSAFIGINELKTPDIKSLAKYTTENKTQFTLKPGKYYIITTIEHFNTPKDIAWIIIPRGTMFRSGLKLLGGLGDPNYKGKATFGLQNCTDHPATIELGARIANVLYFKLDGENFQYDGHYQGGKVGTQGTEDANK